MPIGALLGFLVFAACSGGAPEPTTPASPPAPVATREAISPSPPSPEQRPDDATDASIAPTPYGWWEEAGYCSDGTTLIGTAPPDGQAVACQRSGGTLHGPWAGYDVRPDALLHGAYADVEEHIATGRYERGKRTGAWIWWRSSDVTRDAVGQYADGALHGVFSAYWPNGERSEEGQYDAGEATGMWTFFHVDGRKASDVMMVDGLEQGPHSFYNNAGEVYFQYHFERGRLVDPPR